MDRMNELNQSGEHEAGANTPPDGCDLHRDLLISRVVDADLGSGDESAAAWREFSGAAAGDLSLWRELAEAQHQQVSLCRVLGDAWAVADDVELPTHNAHGMRHGERFSARATRW